jgi:hypothetical protein
MKLLKPETYKPDPGRTVPKDEWPGIRVTPPEQIVSRTCKVESNNDKWRLGKK